MAKTLTEKIESLLPFASEHEKRSFEVIDKALKIRISENNTPEDVVHLQLAALKLLKELSFVATRRVLERLVKLLSTKDPVVKEAVTNNLVFIVEPRLYSLNNTKVFSTQPQSSTLNYLKRLNSKLLFKHLDLFLKLIENMLQLEFMHTQMTDYRKMTFTKVSFPKMSHLVTLRKDVFSFLENLYENCADNKSKLKIIKTFTYFTKTPISAGYSKGIEKMVVENAKSVLSFYNEVYEDATGDIKSEIDDEVGWIERRFSEYKMPELSLLRSRIERDSDYKVYTTLIGYDRYRDLHRNWSEVESERINNTIELANTIINEDWEAWLTKLQEFINNAVGDDIGKYRYLTVLIKEICKIDFDKGLKLLELSNLEWFLGDIYSGLLESDQERTYPLLDTAIEDPNKLQKIAFTSINQPLFPYKLVPKMFQQAFDNGLTEVVSYLLRFVAKRFDSGDSKKTDFFQGLNYLNKQKIAIRRWEIYEISDNLIKCFTKSDRSMILTNLTYSETIDYEQEGLLVKMMQYAVEDVIDFWKHRISIGSKKYKAREPDAKDHYDSIPFEFHHDSQIWQDESEFIVPQILELMKKKDWYYKWEGAQFIKVAYPNFDPCLSKSLVNLASTGKDSDFEIVERILNSYKGENFIVSTVIALINLPIEEKLWKDLFIVLSNTGVVKGEYGFVNEYQNKKVKINELLKNGNEIEKNFLMQYKDYLDSRISYEKKRADLDVYTMKRFF